MERKAIPHPGRKVQTGNFSDAVAVDGWVYISGQASFDLAAGKPLPGTLEEEVRATLDHIGRILAEAGCGFEHVVKCTCYLADIGDFDRFDRAYSACFPGVKPARTTVQSRLASGVKVEIDAVARAPRG